MTFMNFKSFLMTPFKTLFLSQLKSLSKCISHALMPFWIFCCAELCSNNTLIVFPNVCLTSFASKHDHLLQIIGPPNRNDANIFYVNQNCSNSCSNHLIFFLFFCVWGGIFYMLHQFFVDFQTLFWYVSLLQTSWD